MRKVLYVVSILCILVGAPTLIWADSVGPTVTILTPDTGAAISKPSVRVLIQVWDADPPHTTPQVSIDGGAFGAGPVITGRTCGTNCSVYDYTWDISGFGDDTVHTIQAQSTDNLVQTGQSKILSVTVKASKSGDGNLLVRDGSNQICIDCHDLLSHSSQATDTGYGNWSLVCLDCHTPHNTRNIFLVDETIRTPNNGNQSVTFYNETGDATNSYVDSGAANGICEVCHTQTLDPSQLPAIVPRWRNTGNSDTHYTAGSGTQRCTGCHGHTAGFGASCDSCHGDPPTTATLGGPTGLVNNPAATGATNPLSPGAHSLHAVTRNMKCEACHTGGMPASAIPSTSIHFGFSINSTNVPNFNGTITGGVINNAHTPLNAPYSTAPEYVTAAGTTVNTSAAYSWNCTLYCHGSTMDVSGDRNGGTNITPSWVGGSTEADCGTCHGTDNTNPPLRGSHQAHLLGTTIPCSDCHNGYVPPSATTTHVNNQSEFAFDTGKSYLSGASYSGDTTMMNAYGTCSNVACHGTGADSASPQWGTDWTCRNCHRATTLGNLRKIVGGSSDFLRLSRHVSSIVDSRSTQANAPVITNNTDIVTNYDCIVCHMEGDHTSDATDIKIDKNYHPMAPTATNIINLRDVDSYNGSGFSGWAIDKTAWDETQRTNFDNFCMSCHDSDGANTITVNGSNNGLDVGTTPRTRRLTPFNTNDNLRNGWDGFTTRTRVINVKDQFTPDSDGDVTAGNYDGYPSQHGVRGPRYSQTDSNWNASSGTAWTANHTLRNGTDIRTAGETATLHCSDCHLSETNAHGAQNAFHMLLDATVDDFTTDTTMGGLQLSSNVSINVCYKCHSQAIYQGNNPTTGISRYDHDGDSDWYDGYFGYRNGGADEEAYLGSPCLNCHAGEDFGNIHGVTGEYNHDVRTVDPFDGATGTGQTRYRFMPGAWMNWQPGTGGDTQWNTTNNSACYFPASSNWSRCTSHNGNRRTGESVNYGRPTSY